MKNIIVTSLIFVSYLPTVAFAATFAETHYKPLVDLGLGGNNSFDSLINALYALSITIAAFLAVIKIIVAGVKWMMSDVVTNKSDAKKDIYGAIIGLVIVLAAVMILTIINADTVNFSFGLTNLVVETP